MASGGALETALLPYHLVHLECHHHLHLQIALSSRALDFVTAVSLQAISRRPVYCPDDRFVPGESTPFHLRCSEADRVLLWPATGRIVAQCALGVVSCPVTRVFAYADKTRVTIVPALHPRMDTRLYADHLARLRDVGCAVAEVEPGRAASWIDALGVMEPWLAPRRREVAPPVFTAHHGELAPS